MINKLSVFIICLLITACSSSGPKNIGETKLDNNHYYLERYFNQSEKNKSEGVKYYLANIGDGTIEIPESHMWRSKRTGKKIDSDGYFESVFVYEKTNGEYKKYDKLLAIKDSREVLVPVYHCSDDWCQLYVPPISRGAYQQYQSGEIEPFDKDGLFYFISHGLYIKHDDLYKLK